GVVVVEDRAESIPVDLHAARTGPPTDGTAGVVELDGVVEVPALAVVARDDEAPAVTANALAEDFTRHEPAVVEHGQVEAPAVSADRGERRDLLPRLALVGRAQPGTADERTLRRAHHRHEAVLVAVAERRRLLGVWVEDDGLIHQREQPLVRA